MVVNSLRLSLNYICSTGHVQTSWRLATVRKGKAPWVLGTANVVHGHSKISQHSDIQPQVSLSEKVFLVTKQPGQKRGVLSTAETPTVCAAWVLRPLLSAAPFLSHLECHLLPQACVQSLMMDFYKGLSSSVDFWDFPSLQHPLQNAGLLPHLLSWITAGFCMIPFFNTEYSVSVFSLPAAFWLFPCQHFVIEKIQEQCLPNIV